MSLKVVYTCFFLGLMFSSQSLYSQSKDNKKFQVGLNAGLFINGELTSLYALNGGVDAQYYFANKNKFHHFFNGGFTTEIGTDGANWYAFDLGVGTQYHINRPLFVQLSAGPLVMREEFSTQLINGTVSPSFTEFGFKANFAIGYRFITGIGIQCNLTQFNTNATSIGFGVTYSF